MNSEISNKILGCWYFIELNVLTLNAGGLGYMEEEDRYAGVLTCPIIWDIKDNYIYIYLNASNVRAVMKLVYDEPLDLLLDITDESKTPTIYTREKRPFLTETAMKAAVIGQVVGNVIGIQIESQSGEFIKKDSDTCMRADITYNQPAGTWSDDLNTTLATIDGYKDYRYDAPDYETLMKRLCGWNSNEALMRILPAALMEYDKTEHEYESETYINRIFEITALTHGHIRSKLACLIYSYILVNLVNEDYYKKSEPIRKAVLKAQLAIKKYDISISDDEYHEFDRIWNCDELFAASGEDIKSTGYVIDTLEAAIWCFVNTDGYKDCVLKAVNLGKDMGAVGAVAGGMAGLYYGIDDIPKEWKNAVEDKDMIESLIEHLLILK